VEGVSYV